MNEETTLRDSDVERFLDLEAFNSFMLNDYPDKECPVHDGIQCPINRWSMEVFGESAYITAPHVGYSTWPSRAYIRLSEKNLDVDTVPIKKVLKQVKEIHRELETEKTL